GTKTLTGNTVISAISDLTQLKVNAGTLDLGIHTLQRVASQNAVSGGTLTLANGATIRIGGTGTFPTWFGTRNIGSTSTVDYYGTTQSVANETYGNLTLSGNGFKTLPTAPLAIAGKLLGTGTASFTANGPIQVQGDVELNGTAVFNGGSFTHQVAGNWT